MTNVVYTDRLDPYNSSVIRSIFYNRNAKELYVLLRRDDVLCGYENVPESIWTSLVLTDENGESVGSFWNAWIKPNFAGLSTDGLHLVSEDEQQSDNFYSSIYEAFKMANYSDPINVEEPQPQIEFSNFIINYDDDEGFLLLVATSVADAVERFNKMAEIAGWEDITILSVTQFFNA